MRKTINRLLLGIMLMLPMAASSFSLHDYQGACGDTRIQIGPTGGRIAVADTIDNTITIDPITIQTFTPNAIQFVFFHECGHISYGHTSGYDDRDINDENDADCYAAYRFTEEHGRNVLEHTMWEMRYTNSRFRTMSILSCQVVR